MKSTLRVALSVAIAVSVGASPGASMAGHLVGQPVPASLIVIQGGLEWVWASPCAGACGPITLHSGWRYATPLELANRPPNAAFGDADSPLCASAYFDDLLDHHCDWEDLEAGFVTSESDGSFRETLLVRDVKTTLVCDKAAASPALLWPANHKMIPIKIAGVTGSSGDSVAINIDAIMQDEPVKNIGDGSRAPDGAGVGSSSALVRAERAAGGNGRVYVIWFAASDGSGGSCVGSVEVSVPHDRSKKSPPPGNDGASFDSTQP